MISRLHYATNPAGGLLVVPPKPRNCATLSLRSDRVELLCPGTAKVTMPWELCVGASAVTVSGRLRDEWGISHFATGKSGAFGITVSVTGSMHAAAYDVIAATMTRARRFNRWIEGFASERLTSDVVAIIPGVMLSKCDKERATLTVLTRVLSRRAEMRALLADANRVARLAHDLNARQLNFKIVGSGLRRDTIDILIALHALGYFHEFTRPVGTAKLPPLDEVVASTHARLDANPFRRGRTISDEEIAKIVRKAYLDVEPWPFAALLD